MPACVVKWCRSHSRLKCPGITFHNFPVNPIRKKKWMAAVQLERQENDWVPVKTSRVCSLHFNEEDFYKSLKGYSMLHKTAVPVCTTIRPEETSTSLRDTTENEKAIENSASVNVEVCDLPEQFNKTITVYPQAHEAQKRKLVSHKVMIKPDPDALEQEENISGSDDTHRNSSSMFEGNLDFNVIVPILRDMSSHLQTMANKEEDPFESFGKYVATMLRNMPERNSMELQLQIVNLLQTKKI